MWFYRFSGNTKVVSQLGHSNEDGLQRLSPFLWSLCISFDEIGSCTLHKITQTNWLHSLQTCWVELAHKSQSSTTLDSSFESKWFELIAWIDFLSLSHWSNSDWLEYIEKFIFIQTLKHVKVNIIFVKEFFIAFHVQIFQTSSILRNWTDWLEFSVFSSGGVLTILSCVADSPDACILCTCHFIFNLDFVTRLHLVHLKPFSTTNIISLTASSASWERIPAGRHSLVMYVSRSIILSNQLLWNFQKLFEISKIVWN